MSATTNATTRVTLDDFRAGIFADYHASASPSAVPAVRSTSDPRANGAATVENTWGCQADRSGALVPMPRFTPGRTSSPIPNTAHGTALPDTYLLDALLVDGVVQSGVGPQPAPEVVTMTAAVAGPAGFFDQYLVVRRWEEWRTSPVSTDVSFAKCLAGQGANETNLLSGNLTPMRGISDLDLIASGADLIRKGFAWVAHTLQDAQDADAGNQFVTGDITTADEALTDYDTKYAVGGAYPNRLRDALFGWFPSFDIPVPFESTTPRHLDGSASPWRHWGAFLCCTHQGRVVFACTVPSQYENRGGGIYTWRDRITSTELLSPQLDGGAGEFVEENTSGIGLMASLSADEMLVVKHRGGGYLLRGSVASPTIVKLPFIESTEGVVASPVATPLGLVYGTRHGVFMWDGGETSQQMSAQLDGWFWNHLPADSPINYQGHRARFGYWHPWVLAPNGFAFDSRNQSWWRLDNPAGHDAYSVYQVSDAGVLYAFPWKFADGGPVWFTARPGTAASSWSWQSQPIVETRDRAHKVRDFTLLATATDPGSTVTVTISGFDNRGNAITPVTQVVTLDNQFDRPQMRHIDVATTASAMSYMQVRIQGAATGTGKAPKVHSLSLGLLDTNPIPKG
jgi:hypothetical protein